MLRDITPTLILPPQGGGDMEVEITSPAFAGTSLLHSAMTF